MMPSSTLHFFIFVFCCVNTTLSEHEDSLLQFPCIEERTVLFIPDNSHELFLDLFLPITRNFLQKNSCIDSQVFLLTLDKFMPWTMDNNHTLSLIQEMLAIPYSDNDHMKILAVLDDLIAGTVPHGRNNDDGNDGKTTIFYFPSRSFKHTELTTVFDMLDILQQQEHDVLIYCDHETCPRNPVFPSHRVIIISQYHEDQKRIVASIKNPDFKIHQFNKALIAKRPLKKAINCKPNMQINFFSNHNFLDPMIRLISIIVHDFIPVDSDLQIGISSLELQYQQPLEVVDYSWPIDRRLSEYGLDDRVSRIKNFTVVHDRYSICSGGDGDKLSLTYPGAPDKERLDIFFDLISSIVRKCCISLSSHNKIHFAFNDDRCYPGHVFLNYVSVIELVNEVVDKINAQC